MQKFTDLIAWQKGHELVLFVYSCTKKFPADERFALSDQLRRAAVSITSNIAEGFGRRTAQDKVHFYTMSKTSLSEIENQFLIARDLGYLTPALYKEFETRAEGVQKLLGGLMKSAASKPTY